MIPDDEIVREGASKIVSQFDAIQLVMLVIILALMFLCYKLIMIILKDKQDTIKFQRESNRKLVDGLVTQVNDLKMEMSSKISEVNNAMNNVLHKELENRELLRELEKSKS